MRTRTHALLAITTAALLTGCGAHAQAPAPEPEPAGDVETGLGEEQLTDERVTELASGYLDLMHDRAWEQLWEHVAPEGRQNFGSFEEFRTSGANIMDRLETPVAVESETVEPARAGMLADRLYMRVAYYSGGQGRRVRLLVGLMKDGSIAGIQIQPVQ